VRLAGITLRHWRYALEIGFGFKTIRQEVRLQNDEAFKSSTPIEATQSCTVAMGSAVSTMCDVWISRGATYLGIVTNAIQ
jgi:hypothetical protein